MALRVIPERIATMAWPFILYHKLLSWSIRYYTDSSVFYTIFASIYYFFSTDSLTTSIPHSFVWWTTLPFAFFLYSLTLSNFSSIPGYFILFWASWHDGYLHSGFTLIRWFEKKSVLELYVRQKLISPKFKRYLRAFWTRNPAVIPIVVGNLAAQTPYLFIIP